MNDYQIIEALKLGNRTGRPVIVETVYGALAVTSVREAGGTVVISTLVPEAKA